MTVLGYKPSSDEPLSALFAHPVVILAGIAATEPCVQVVERSFLSLEGICLLMEYEYLYDKIHISEYSKKRRNEVLLRIGLLSYKIYQGIPLFFTDCSRYPGLSSSSFGRVIPSINAAPNI